MTVPPPSARPDLPGPYPAPPHPQQSAGFGPPSAGWGTVPGQAVPPGAHGAQPVVQCRACGGWPAARVTFRRHQGVLLMMRFHRIDGPFCRNCATVVYREETAGTLWQGWWSPLSLVLFTPGTLISNRVALARTNKLAEPAGGFPAYRARPGKPVLRRASSLAALAPLAWAVWVIANIVNDVTS